MSAVKLAISSNRVECTNSSTFNFFDSLLDFLMSPIVLVISLIDWLSSPANQENEKRAQENFSNKKIKVIKEKEELETNLQSLNNPLKVFSDKIIKKNSSLTKNELINKYLVNKLFKYLTQIGLANGNSLIEILDMFQSVANIFTVDQTKEIIAKAFLFSNYPINKDCIYIDENGQINKLEFGILIREAAGVNNEDSNDANNKRINQIRFNLASSLRDAITQYVIFGVK